MAYLKEYGGTAFVIFIIIICLFFHPFIHIKYWYQCLTNNSTQYLSICNGYYRNNIHEMIHYESNDYFSKNPKKNLDVFDISNFNNDGLIYIEALLYDSLDNVTVFLNNKKIKIEKDTDYYNIFNKNYYIVKTIRIWVSKQNLIADSTNKIDFIVGKDIYSYYFNIIN